MNDDPSRRPRRNPRPTGVRVAAFMLRVLSLPLLLVAFFFVFPWLAVSFEFLAGNTLWKPDLVLAVQLVLMTVGLGMREMADQVERNYAGEEALTAAQSCMKRAKVILDWACTMLFLLVLLGIGALLRGAAPPLMAVTVLRGLLFAAAYWGQSYLADRLPGDVDS